MAVGDMANKLEASKHTVEPSCRRVAQPRAGQLELHVNRQIVFFQLVGYRAVMFPVAFVERPRYLLT